MNNEVYKQPESLFESLGRFLRSILGKQTVKDQIKDKMINSKKKKKMSKLTDKVFNTGKGFHKNSDGSWGTDPHDADILKGFAEVITAIIKGIVSFKK